MLDITVDWIEAGELSNNKRIEGGEIYMKKSKIKSASILDELLLEADPLGDIFGGGGGGDTAADPSTDTSTDSADSTSTTDSSGGDDDKAKNSIKKYSEELKKMKKMRFQKSIIPFEFTFEGSSDYYNHHFSVVNDNGSLLVSIPFDVKNKQILAFVNKNILPKIFSVIKLAKNFKKNIVVLGDYGFSFKKGVYNTNVSGKISKVIVDKFGDKNISFDDWNPVDYSSALFYKFILNELKKRTNVDSVKIKVAVNLFYFLSFDNQISLKTLEKEKYEKILKDWGINQDNMNTNSGKEYIRKKMFPDIYKLVENELSYLIKVYLQVVRIHLMRKVDKLERSDKIVSVFCDYNTGWILLETFKNLNILFKKKKDDTKKNKKSDDTKKDEKDDSEKKDEKSDETDGEEKSDEKDNDKKKDKKDKKDAKDDLADIFG